MVINRVGVYISASNDVNTSNVKLACIRRTEDVIRKVLIQKWRGVSVDGDETSWNVCSKLNQFQMKRFRQLEKFVQ